MMCPFDPTVELEEIEFLDQEYLGCPKCEEIWRLPLGPKKGAVPLADPRNGWAQAIRERDQRIAELTAQVAVLRDALKIVLTARCCDYGHRMCGTAAARAGSALAATEKKP